jgi:flagellar assembly protein FliH
MSSSRLLSKVLSGRDTEKAQPVAFSAAAGSSVEQSRNPAPPEDVPPEPDNQLLLDQIQRLEREAALAKKAAFEAGIKQGAEQSRLDLAPVLERLHASIAETIGMRHEIRRRAEKDVVQLSLLIAKRVLHRELSVDDSALTALARVVFERLARSEQYLVVVHPRFAAAIGAALRGNQIGQIRIEPDPDCAPGTFTVRTGDGLIDGSIDAQLEEITRGLTDRLALSEKP